MSTNKQRREAERLRLQRQLEQRRRHDASRRRVNTIVAVAGSLVLVAAIVVIVVVSTSGGSKSKNDAKSRPTSDTPTSAASSTAPQCGAQTFPATTVKPATGASVSFDGVTVKGATDLTGEPGVTSTSKSAPAKLEYKDLVVGTGAAATDQSCVNVQYAGVLYDNGTAFDSSWSRGMPAQFSLEGVVPGFTEGIGGTTGVPPMRVGGRRIMILPASLAYGAQGSPPKVPANAPLVFVVDLLKIVS